MKECINNSVKSRWWLLGVSWITSRVQEYFVHITQIFFQHLTNMIYELQIYFLWCDVWYSVTSVVSWKIHQNYYTYIIKTLLRRFVHGKKLQIVRQPRKRENSTFAHFLFISRKLSKQNFHVFLCLLLRFMHLCFVFLFSEPKSHVSWVDVDEEIKHNRKNAFHADIVVVLGFTSKTFLWRIRNHKIHILPQQHL